MNSNQLNKIIIAIVTVIIILTIILLSKSCSMESDTATIKLIGSEKIVLRQYDNYIEYGYKIVNQKSNGYSVKIDGKVNTKIIGNYDVTYNLYNNKNKLISSVTRHIYVLVDDLSSTKIVLKGEATEYYFVGDYKDNGFIAYRNNENISNMVLTNSNVDSNKPGRYIVEYYIQGTNSKKSVTREVYIIDLDVNKTILKSEHIIKLSINVSGYDHVVLPNEGTNKNSNITYKYATGNLRNEYVFDIYLKTGSHKKYVIDKSELGVDSLSGTCTLSYGNKTTTITMQMNDISKVSKFKVSGEEFTGTSKTINGYKSKVTVGAYNEAGQVTTITCTGTPPTPTPRPTSTPKGSGSTVSKLDEGIKTVTGHNNGNFPCKYDVTADNQALDNAVKKYGYKTRGAVMAAGLFLGNYRFNVQYYWAGKYDQKGLNSNWGCGGMGLDCTGFVKWAFIQAGFEASMIPRSSQSTTTWGSFNASSHLYEFNESNLSAASHIKPGDIASTPYVHSALVIGVTSDTVQIAQQSTGVNIVTIRKRDGRKTDGSESGITHFVLMDEFYKEYGN